MPPRDIPGRIESEELKQDPLFVDLLAGRETPTMQIDELLLAVPVQSHNNAESKKREKKNRFKV